MPVQFHQLTQCPIVANCQVSVKQAMTILRLSLDKTYVGMPPAVMTSILRRAESRAAPLYRRAWFALVRKTNTLPEVEQIGFFLPKMGLIPRTRSQPERPLSTYLSDTKNVL